MSRIVGAGGGIVLASAPGEIGGGTPGIVNATIVNSGLETGLTAHAGGTQAAALALSGTKTVHKITVCATTADSVKLFAPAAAGRYDEVYNDGAASMQLFADGTGTLNGVATATGLAVPAGYVAKCRAITTGAAATWKVQIEPAVVDTVFVPKALVTAKGDLVSATGSGVPAALGVGSNGKVLSADSGEATGLKWVTPAAAFDPASPGAIGGTVAAAGSFTTLTMKSAHLFDANSITAGAGTARGDAVALSASAVVHQVIIAPLANAALLLPNFAALPQGTMVKIINATASALNIYPFSAVSDYLNDGASGAAIVLPALSIATCQAIADGHPIYMTVDTLA